MSNLTIFKTLGSVDLKNIRRDSMLVWIPLIPLLLALVYRLGLPPIAAFSRQQWGLDLETYYPLLLSGFVIMAPGIAGMVVGFLLLDERDDGVTSALLVTPLPILSYLLYRLAAPLLLGLAMTLVGYPLIGLVPLPVQDLVAVSLLASLTGPLLALFLGSFAENKVTGFALVKLVNGIMLVPIAAFFITFRWHLLAGFVPTYWPLKVFWLASTSQPYLAYLLAGFGVNLAAILLLLRRFRKVIYQV